MKAKIKVIIKRPDEQYGHVTHISHTLKNLQNTVDGYIETVPVVKDTIMICNEEGKILNLPFNMRLYGDAIHGTIIICGVDGEDFADVPISLSIWKGIVDRMENML